MQHDYSRRLVDADRWAPTLGRDLSMKAESYQHLSRDHIGPQQAHADQPGAER